MRLPALVLVLTACSPVTTPTRCAPGVQIACPCPGGGEGAQACNADGASYGACVCGPDDAGGAEDASAEPDVAAADVAAADTNCGTGRVRCGAACVDTLTDGTNCGTCGRVCGTATQCVSGTCLAAGDAGGMDAPDDAAPGRDVVDTGSAGDVPDAGAVACTTPEGFVLRRCTSNADCGACAAGTSGYAWCCGITGYCENRRSCDADAGFRPYQPDAQIDCVPNTGAPVLVCRTHEDCARTCMALPNRVWCCSSGGECGTRTASGCSM